MCQYCTICYSILYNVLRFEKIRIEKGLLYNSFVFVCITAHASLCMCLHPSTCLLPILIHAFSATVYGNEKGATLPVEQYCSF